MRPTKALLAASALALTVCAAIPASADEPLFGFVYTTDLLPKDHTEVEQWETWRAGKAHGIFNVIENRTEVEYGVTDALQLSAYLNTEWSNAYNDNVIDGTTLPPETFAEVQVGPHEHFNLAKFTGVSAEAIWRLMSPYTDPFGLAFYVEPTVGPATRELESRVIFQKNFMDDRLVFAFNTTIAQELRYLHGDPGAPASSEESYDHWDKEADVNFGLAGSYRFAESWYAGVEFENEHEWAGFDPFADHKRTNNAYYAGPTIHYGGERFFATLTVLDQLPWAEDYANPAPGFVIGGRNYADDFERFRVRLKIGYTF
jgi:hypothetical protein